MATSWMVQYKKINWRKVLLMALAAYVVAFCFRAHEIPSWNNPDYKLDGEYLLATHDAYYWMAGAVGFGPGAEHPMSQVLKGLSSITGASPANIGFWLPLFIAPLVASVVTIWAVVFGVRNSGIVAGVLACLAPGFLGRTLLGYCDTDLVTLLFALVIGLVPAMWLAPAMRSPMAVLGNFLGADVRRLAVISPKQVRGNPLSRKWLLALFLSGLFGHWAKEWHSLFTYLIVWYALLVPLAISICSIRSERATLLRAAPVYALPLIGGMWGAVLGFILLLGLINVIPRLNKIIWQKKAPLLLWAIVLFGAIEPHLFTSLWRMVGSYMKSGGDVAASLNATEALVYPGVAQSIIEVQDLKPGELLLYFHPWLFAVILGIVGFFVLFCISPAAAFHLPLIALAFLSVKLGGRMVMFGGASIALGLAVPVCLAVEAFLSKEKFKKWGEKIPFGDIFILFLLVPYISLIPRLSQGPMIYIGHAQGVKYLEANTPETSLIWTWWDWGYVTQYLSLRHTLADGALHGGPYLYLPALVYSTSNPLLASQMIKYTALNGGPEKVLAGKSKEEVTALIQQLGTQDVGLKTDDNQYLVVTFDMLRLGYWISKHGNWDFIEKSGKAYNISRIKNSLKYNLDSGLVNIEGRDPLQADSIDILTENGLVRESYFRFNQRHFVLNFLSGDKLILDDDLYNSLLVQLLICSPNDKRYKKYFTLIFDNIYCRVYKVN